MRLPLLLAGLLLSQGVLAAPAVDSNSKIDLFYVNSNLKVDDVSGSLNGAGYGIRGWIGRSWPIVTAEYQKSEIDGSLGGSDAEGDLETLRGGLGVRLIETPGLSLWGRVEYVAIDLGFGGTTAIDDDGFALHIGVRGGDDALGAHVEFGAIQMSDAKGTEGRIGVAWQPNNWGLFAEYRMTMLNPDNSANDLKLGDARAGLRWAF